MLVFKLSHWNFHSSSVCRVTVSLRGISSSFDVSFHGLKFKIDRKTAARQFTCLGRVGVKLSSASSDSIKARLQLVLKVFKYLSCQNGPFVAFSESKDFQGNSSLIIFTH